MDLTALSQFLTRHGLSLGDFTELCQRTAAAQRLPRNKGISRSTIHRFLTNALAPDYAALLRPVAREAVTAFARTLAAPPADITAELRAVYPDYTEGELLMLNTRTSLSPEAIEHFKLSFDPFAPERDPRTAREVFTTKEHEKLLQAATDAINYQGLVCIVGDIGGGKTILKKRLCDSVNRSDGRLRLVWLNDPEMVKLTPAAIMADIVAAFGQKPKGRRGTLKHQLREILTHAAANSVRVALGIDEAHRLHDDTLTALKQFWEMDNGGFDRFLGVVMFAQSQFTTRLQDFRFRELIERIKIYPMPTFTKQRAGKTSVNGKAAWDYVALRLALAGGKADELIDPAAVTLLARKAPTPLALGNELNRALNEAAADGQPKLVAAMLNLTAADDDEPKVIAMRQAS